MIFTCPLGFHLYIHGLLPLLFSCCYSLELSLDDSLTPSRDRSYESCIRHQMRKNERDYIFDTVLYNYEEYSITKDVEFPKLEKLQEKLCCDTRERRHSREGGIK